VHGDLHSLGSVLIFNAAVQPDTSPIWEWDVPPPDFEREKAIILFDSPQSFFERRGVFTIVGSVATDALKRYVEEGKTHYAKLLGGE
jgi:hypothetical protein